MNGVPSSSPDPAWLEPPPIAGTPHVSGDQVPFAADGGSASSRTSSGVSRFRDPRDCRARRRAQRFRLVVQRSRQTGLYGLLDYASRRSIADGLTLDQLEDALVPEAWQDHARP
jgi:hypothetical protein